MSKIDKIRERHEALKQQTDIDWTRYILGESAVRLHQDLGYLLEVIDRQEKMLRKAFMDTEVMLVELEMRGVREQEFAAAEERIKELEAHVSVCQKANGRQYKMIQELEAKLKKVNNE